MAAKNIEVAFHLKKRVMIEPIQVEGKIIAIYVSDTGIQYQVRYFYDGTPHSVYFYGYELGECDG